MKVHFIAIGGSAMHNLAIALKQRGYEVAGSDDQIFEPSKSRLIKYGLMPGKVGWQPGKINSDIDAVIVGMHARKDNSELLKARELGLTIYSYPEFLYYQSKDKTRIVIGGSHGKTTITSIVLHVLHNLGVNADFMVGAQLEGFEVMVKLTDDADFVVLEGDEYPSSPVDLRPKFHLYKPHIALISGIAWDHINVFPTFEDYVQQFEKFIDVIEKNGKLIYCAEDKVTKSICEKAANKPIEKIPYKTPAYEANDSGVNYIIDNKKYPVSLFGKHNLMNINAARLICSQIGISGEDFFNAVKSFKGASNRLEKIAESGSTVIYKDFAHAPSKLKATIEAVREQYSNKKLIACIELHTFSSLSEAFLPEYKNSMQGADVKMVYYDPGTIASKNLKPVNPETVKNGFNHKDLLVFTDINQLISRLQKEDLQDSCLLFMSSGSFGGQDLNDIAGKLLPKYSD